RVVRLRRGGLLAGGVDGHDGKSSLSCSVSRVRMDRVNSNITGQLSAASDPSQALPSGLLRVAASSNWAVKRTLTLGVRHRRPTPQVLVQIQYRTAIPLDSEECIRIRGITRENAISSEVLAGMGITVETLAKAIEAGELSGFVCMAGSQIAGYCFGASATGEIVVLALRREFEGMGVGRELLSRVAAHLGKLGHSRLFLACSADSSVRSHGFYRHLGWRSTGVVDHHGDEVLELQR
ncbi:GNAT family N-acetyltransferase, partial [Roseateles sp. LKC17W]